MAGALQDLRVIDFTHALNGPFCTMLLGHLGAEIIKIEPPSGDRFRRSWMPRDAKKDGYEFLWINVNKKSVALILKSERGVELARQLITRADVLVENFQQGTMERFGLDYESLKTLNPRLIYACSRGYGETGPYAHYGNTAQSNNSMTGWTHTQWGYSGTPGKKALGIGDEAAGLSMCVGILAALHARERTGEGQKIVVSMQEAVLGFMISSMHEYFTGIDVGNQPIPVADGFFTLRVPDISDQVWSKLAHLMGRDDLVQDPRFVTAAARRQHQTELEELIKAWAGGKPARNCGTACATWITLARLSCRLARCSKIRTSKHGKRSLSAIIRLPGRRRCWRHGFICRRLRPASATMRRRLANIRTRFSVVS